MKSSRMMWVVVTLVVSATMAITFGTQDSRSQLKPANQTESLSTPTISLNATEEFKKTFPRVNYEDSHIIDPARQKKGEKYNKYSVLNPVHRKERYNHLSC